MIVNWTVSYCAAGAFARIPGVRRTAPGKHAARGLTCRVKQITNEDIAKNPWTSPGWRGAYVSSQPEATQTAIVAGVTLLGAILTYVTYTTAGPWVCNNVPLMDTYMEKAPFIQGPLIAAAGIAHFYPSHQLFCEFYPHRGAWGFWYAPPRPHQFDSFIRVYPTTTMGTEASMQLPCLVVVSNVEQHRCSSGICQARQASMCGGQAWLRYWEAWELSWELWTCHSPQTGSSLPAPLACSCLSPWSAPQTCTCGRTMPQGRCPKRNWTNSPEK